LKEFGIEEFSEEDFSHFIKKLQFPDNDSTSVSKLEIYSNAHLMSLFDIGKENAIH